MGAAFALLPNCSRDGFRVRATPWACAKLGRFAYKRCQSSASKLPLFAPLPAPGWSASKYLPVSCLNRRRANGGSATISWSGKHFPGPVVFVRSAATRSTTAAPPISLSVG
jgi:hypothetical protein